MYPLKQSTAIDVLFFLHDSNGDAVTGKTDGNFTKNISKAAGVFSAMSGGEAASITERAGGWYLIQLSSTNTNTLGILTIYLVVAGVKQVNLQYRVGGLPLVELGVGVPSATPTMEDAIALLYMAIRNKLTTTSGLLSIYNDADAVIAKANLTDDGSTFTRSELISG